MIGLNASRVTILDQRLRPPTVTDGCLAKRQWVAQRLKGENKPKIYLPMSASGSRNEVSATQHLTSDRCAIYIFLRSPFSPAAVNVGLEHSTLLITLHTSNCVESTNQKFHIVLSIDVACTRYNNNTISPDMTDAAAVPSI